MGVYLGECGHIELKRDQTDPTAPSVTAEITPEDVNTDRQSLSVEEAYLSFITGDRIEITTIGTDPNDVTTRPDLNFIKDWADPSITRYVSVDPVGRMRLYESFDDAVNDRAEVAVELETPSEQQTIRLRSAGGARTRCLAQVTNFSFTTSRSNINTTVLSQQYVDQYEAGLIQGQGQLSCFWEHRYGLCDKTTTSEQELPAYLAKLVLRLNQGSDFWGRFFIFAGDDEQKSVWYECPKCIITNVVVNVTPAQIITTDISFVAASGLHAAHRLRIRSAAAGRR